MSRSLAALLLVTTALLLLGSGCRNGGEAATAGQMATVETQTSPSTTGTHETMTGEVAPPTSTVSKEGQKALPPTARLSRGSKEFAASGLQALTDCRGRTGVARLTWRPAPKRGPQRIAVTILPEVSDPHNFDLVSMVPETASSLLWKGVEGQAIHTWIVLTKQARGWAASPPAMFTGPSCMTDFNSP